MQKPTNARLSTTVVPSRTTSATKPNRVQAHKVNTIPPRHEPSSKPLSTCFKALCCANIPSPPNLARQLHPTMNTISPPPQIRRISAGKRALGVFVGIAGGLGANALLGYSVLSFYTRGTQFVPYDTSASDFSTALFEKHNPSANPPVCIDHAIKSIPYAKLPGKYLRKANGGGVGVDQAQLATDFCRGVWGGLAYRVQRRYLERKYRGLPGREGHLWDVKELERSGYEVGTKITDHFEVVEHTDEKVRFPGTRYPR
jgi:hypothetical protein